jgi:hypothetical protein
MWVIYESDAFSNLGLQGAECTQRRVIGLDFVDFRSLLSNLDLHTFNRYSELHTSYRKFMPK